MLTEAFINFHSAGDENNLVLRVLSLYYDCNFISLLDYGKVSSFIVNVC